ncbi:MAG: squalene--hopene cyclase [Alphaproteobacteria bacterium]|nr:squalene--hopene cyclase [Alphaproteobacteria bacterium]
MIVNSESLQQAVQNSAQALEKLQKPDGHWVFELESDATIPAEYVLLDHFISRLDEKQLELHARIANYLRSIQEPHGGWPLYRNGALNVSATVKAYFALKCFGDDVDAPHMKRAREALFAHGGAARANVFTRIQMALFGAVPWRAVPVMPVEIMSMPRWFPFHMYKIAYWSRTVIAPMLVLCALKPLAVNPKKIGIAELFVTPPDQVKNWHSLFERSALVPLFRVLDSVLRVCEPYFPKKFRQKSMDRCLDWIKTRLNGLNGLGAIYPAMAYAVMMYHALGTPRSNPDYETAIKSIDLMMIDLPERTYCQPCLSPVWDTALSAHAALEAGLDKNIVYKACDWLVPKQILDVVGDWAFRRPDVLPGGWAFQYDNPHYPDLDDTAVVVMAMDRLDRNKYQMPITRAVDWILGLQSKNGGFAAFDADNTYYYLNYIPFSDHGALLDPPSADVTARCVSMLAQLGYKNDHKAMKAALAYLRREQEEEGCWFGRWGTNYIYGTWSVLCALNAVGIAPEDPMMQRAVSWLVSKQQADGGWGESGDSYYKGKPKGEGAKSTPAQTAWSLMALMAAGAVDHPATAKGIEHLIQTQKPDGTWDENDHTAVGFPRVYYLHYHGYRAFFPLWALARYRNLKTSNTRRVTVGM